MSPETLRVQRKGAMQKRPRRTMANHLVHVEQARIRHKKKERKNQDLREQNGEEMRLEQDMLLKKDPEVPDLALRTVHHQRVRQTSRDIIPEPQGRPRDKGTATGVVAPPDSVLQQRVVRERTPGPSCPQTPLRGS